jgi:hypothetical protein
MKLVSPEKLSAVWPRIERWIDDAVKLNQGDENLLDVLIAIARGHYLLWEAPTYAVVGQVQTYPQQTVGVILYCGGSDVDAMKVAFEDAKRWCAGNGISVIRTFGRPGWAKVLDLMPVGVILQTKVL